MTFVAVDERGAMNTLMLHCLGDDSYTVVSRPNRAVNLINGPKSVTYFSCGQEYYIDQLIDINGTHSLLRITHRSKT